MYSKQENSRIEYNKIQFIKEMRLYNVFYTLQNIR